MKKLFCIILSVLLLTALFAGCKNEPIPETTDTTLPALTETTTELPEETSPAEIGGIHYKGIVGKEVTPAMLEAAEGRPFDVETLAGEDTMYIYNNVDYQGITYPQLQCILFGDHTSITLTYKLSQGETLEQAMQTISSTISPMYGEPSVSTSGTASNIWRDATVNENYINLYVLNDTELKLCFILY